MPFDFELHRAAGRLPVFKAGFPGNVENIGEFPMIPLSLKLEMSPTLLHLDEIELTVFRTDVTDARTHFPSSKKQTLKGQ